MARWLSPDGRDKAWRFRCSACGNDVYYPQYKLPRKCPYRICPWCGEKIESESKGEEEEQ